MGWVEPLKGHVVALDTAPLISFMAGEEPYVALLRPLFAAIAEGEIQAVTSTVTLIEVLVKPLRENDLELANQYKDILLQSENLVTYPMTAEISLAAAELRANLNLRTPDAIQAATARIGGADFFITNDLRVPEGLRKIVLDEVLKIEKER